MKRSTPILFTPEAAPLDHNSHTLFLGSCFAVNMAEKFDFFCLPQTTNPFGVLFQPLAIEQLIGRAIENQEFTLDDLNQREDIWYNYQAHTSLSGIDPSVVVDRLNQALGELSLAIHSASHIVLTLGTAWVYRHLETDRVVANCHKQPGQLFDKELLNPQKIQKSLERTLSAIQKENPEAVFIMTVSPVRHTKDGMIQNARSKAHLLTAIHTCVANTDKAYYFPAYEVMMDELRDYRYYHSDLVHPNDQAIYHIWEGFKTAWLAPTAISLFDEIGRLKAAMNHKTQIPGSNAHRDFKQQLKQRLDAFKQQYPHIVI